jgi:hypothetical protein
MSPLIIKIHQPLCSTKRLMNFKHVRQSTIRPDVTTLTLYENVVVNLLNPTG